ncbi:MAG TPA: Gfo/Idh/MocA family oxidoreductase [Acidobacteriota bacterium]|nr:Gfo/Idh/MocA family oxidoreductase [Acidobacteriota bacterium]
MSESSGKSTSRRGFLKDTSKIASITTLAAGLAPHVHAAENNTIKLALVGCGGRGSGAAKNALSVENGPIKLVAMGDVFEERLNRSYQVLSEQYPDKDKMDVPEDRRFSGFDAYKSAIDCLEPGDVVAFATPPAFRWPYFEYAIEKGINVFMEKPVTVDGPTTRRMIQLGERAGAKNLKVGVGLMCRHCDARRELFDRVQNGEIGEVLSLRAYRMHGPVGYFASPPKPKGISELRYQVQRFHSFLWASGGAFSDFYIHNIDESCWMKDTWPVKAQGMGGRFNRGDNVDQNFDNYTVEYSFGDDVSLVLYGRCIDGCHDEFASYVHGSKGSAVISTSSHTPAKCRIYKSQEIDNEADLVWAYPQPERNPYQIEWDELIDAIRQDKPYNEVKRGAEASLVTSMGRMAAHTGQVVTFDEILNLDHEFAPGVREFTEDSPAPLQLGPDGRYPFPEPGVKSLEY